MRTRERLARDLLEVGLEELATRAARGEFDDYASPHISPQMTLAAELAIIGNDGAMRIRQAVIDGAYDATDEEAAEWAESPEGQETFEKLVKGE
ncbi:MAG: hypothetical protein ABWY64_21485 [Tardiphaga sp.]